MRHAIEVTLTLKATEVAPGKLIFYEVTVKPSMPFEYLCEIAMLLASELELRRVQGTNDIRDRPEIPLVALTDGADLWKSKG